MMNILMVSVVSGRNIKKAMIWVTANEILITYIGHTDEVGFLPDKYLKIK